MGLELLLSKDLKVRDFSGVSTESLLLTSSSPFQAPSVSPSLWFQSRSSKPLSSELNMWMGRGYCSGKYASDGVQEGRCHCTANSCGSSVLSAWWGAGQEVNNMCSHSCFPMDCLCNITQIIFPWPLHISILGANLTSSSCLPDTKMGKAHMSHTSLILYTGDISRHMLWVTRTLL